MQTQKLTTSKKSITFGKDSDSPYLTMEANGILFNPQHEKAIRLKDNRLIVESGDPDNLWALDGNGNKVPLISMTGYRDKKKVIESIGNLGERAGNLKWSSDPHVGDDGHTVYFESNRDTVQNKNFLDSIYSVDTSKGTEPQMVLNSEKYQSDIQFLGVKGKKVAVFLGHKNSFLSYDLEANEEKIYSVNGFPVSISPTGENILFRKVAGGVILPDLFLLDLATGGERKIGMVQGYFFNTDGAWSPDGTKYAFSLNGENGNDPNNGWYRTNIKIGVIDITSGKITSFDKPSNKSNLYQLGHISWYRNNSVIVNTDDNNTWALILK